MKKLTGIILAGAIALSMGTPAFAAGTNNGNHYGWEKGTHNPHKSEVTPTDNTVSQAKINEIINDLNHLEELQLNARYENGWIKMDMNLHYVVSQWQWSIVTPVLDNHNVKVVDYAVENVEWSQGADGMIGTDHWGTVCIKVGKK